MGAGAESAPASRDTLIPEADLEVGDGVELVDEDVVLLEEVPAPDTDPVLPPVEDAELFEAVGTDLAQLPGGDDDVMEPRSSGMPS